MHGSDYNPKHFSLTMRSDEREILELEELINVEREQSTLRTDARSTLGI